MQATSELLAFDNVEDLRKYAGKYRGYAQTHNKDIRAMPIPHKAHPVIFKFAFPPSDKENIIYKNTTWQSISYTGSMFHNNLAEGRFFKEINKIIKFLSDHPSNIREDSLYKYIQRNKERRFDIAKHGHPVGEPTVNPNANGNAYLIAKLREPFDILTMYHINEYRYNATDIRKYRLDLVVMKDRWSLTRQTHPFTMMVNYRPHEDWVSDFHIQK